MTEPTMQEIRDALIEYHRARMDWTAGPTVGDAHRRFSLATERVREIACRLAEQEHDR